jgi:hypothetical protein
MIDQLLLLDKKYEAQKKLNDEAGNDIETYFKNCRQNVIEMSKKYGVKIRYSKAGKPKRESKIA